MRKLTLVCAILGLSMGFVACSDDDSSSSDKVAVGGKCKVAAECQSNVCENGVCVAKATDADACKKEGDVCDKDGNKTCQKENDKLVCKDKPADVEADACKKEGDKCGKDNKKTCQKENDKLVCKDKPAGSDADACKDKNEGDKCGEGMICDAQKKCVADLRECSKDEDCSTTFPKCDTEANLCYKVNADYQINCSSAGDKKTAYMAEWIYKDNSKESKIISEECTGEKSDCKEGVGCAVPTTAQERECYVHEDCKNNGTKTVCGNNRMCIEPECSPESPCADDTKQCDEGVCIPKSA